MASSVQKVERKGVIMVLLSLVLISTGCEDRIDPPAVNPSEGKTVEVTLNLGIANEKDGAAASTSPTSKTGSSIDSQSAFEVVPVSEVHTKATGDVPDKLYNLDIIQYTSSGSTVSATISEQSIGTAFAAATVKLTQDTGSKLLLVARGSSPDFESLSNKSISAVQEMTVKAVDSKLNAISTDATGNGLANMPYYLYLENVNITSEGKIESPEGKDVRLMLKRLAVKVQLDWTISSSMKADGYVLKEVKLCQVPAHYRLIPQREATDRWGEVYPTSVAEFVDFYRLKGAKIEDGTTTTNTVWIPANARGISAYATSPLYRNKNNANAAATYAEFVVDNITKKERLYYRAYLGGNETNDFNLLENRNYHWTININKANYINDPRIQLLDQTPVISTNLQPTANCFMMVPGTNICFNPYKHEAGTNGWNTYLTDGNGNINSYKEITKVEVLWQTKDAGTSGDLVLGYFVDETNHENLVNLTDGSNINNARIHVKAPNTNGGNAVIAAYNNNTIVWSWHIWISDYVPATLTGDIASVSRLAAIEAAQNATRNGMVHVYGGISWTDPNGSFYKCVIMDRNLGATKGGLQNNAVDWVRTFGMLYQGGRKDPIFGTPDGGTDESHTIYDGNGNALELDKTSAKIVPTLDQTIQNPLKFYGSPVNNWNGDASKSIHDPCPKGWRIPSNEYLNNGSSNGISLADGWNGFVYNKADSKASMCAGFGRTESDYVCEWNLTEKNSNNIMYYDGSQFNTLIGQGYGGAVSSVNTDAFTGTNGAGYLYFGGSGENENSRTNKSAFFPAAILRELNKGTFRTNKSNKLFLWSSSSNGNGQMQMYEFQSGLLSFQHTNPSGYGFSVRCIQDNIKDRSYSDYQNGK